MRALSLSCLLPLILAACGLSTSTTPPTDGDRPNLYAVLAAGDTLEFRNSNGTMKVHADSNLKRTFTWDGVSRSVTMDERKEPWYGALGLYFPGPGDHWLEHKGVTRGVISEETMDFPNLAAFEAWLKDQEKLYDSKFTPDGLVAGWSIDLSRNALNVEIHRVTIAGKRPVSLKGGTTDWFTWTKAGK